jgi:hypothetical protein
MYDLDDNCRSNVTNLNGYKLQYFIEDPQTMSSIGAVHRKSLHSLHFFMNRSILLFIPHFLLLIFRLSANSTIHGLVKGNTAQSAPKMISWIHFSTRPTKQ